MDEIFLENTLLIHLLDERTNFLLSELPDVVAEKNFVFGQCGQRSRDRSLQSSLGHKHTFFPKMANGKL